MSEVAKLKRVTLALRASPERVATLGEIDDALRAGVGAPPRGDEEGLWATWSPNVIELLATGWSWVEVKRMLVRAKEMSSDPRLDVILACVEWLAENTVVNIVEVPVDEDKLVLMMLAVLTGKRP